MGLMGDPIAAPSNCSKYLSLNRKMVFLKQNSSRLMIFPANMVVLGGSALSCSNLSLIMVGTDVKNVFTSNEQYPVVV